MASLGLDINSEVSLYYRFSLDNLLVFGYVILNLFNI